MRYSRTRLALAATITASAITAPAIVQGHVAKLNNTRAAAVATESVCAKVFTIKDYRIYAKNVYKRNKVSFRAHRRMRNMHRCQHSWKARKHVSKLHIRFKAQRVQRARARKLTTSLTPYRCSFGRSAIPCYIVMCESGGSWNAANPSGAIGRYQFLGWPVPWPVRTEAHKQAHHRMAAKLWAGGNGRSHWAQCL